MRTLLRTKVRRAFTLIEILIVVVILGILAAIVIPQFTDASQQAQASNLVSQLQTIRSQIELHDVQWPQAQFDPINGFMGAAAPWGQLVTGDTAFDPDYDGNYLASPPRNPFFNDSAQAVAVAAGAPDGASGWVWGDPLGFGTSIYAAVPAGFADYNDGANYFDFDEDGQAE